MDLQESRSEVHQFDLQLLYLRKVHFYCYFSCSEYNDERIMSTKCGAMYLRDKILDDESSENLNVDKDKLIESTIMYILKILHSTK